MEQTVLFSLALILVLGIGGQVVAWRLRLPSILILLLMGFLAGPITGVIDPDAIFGDLLLPIVSLSVAVILFEGGLTLRFAEFREARSVVVGLMTTGTAVTWFVCAVAARFLLGWDWGLAILLGAILVVTGPTVIIPLLRHIRPTGRVAAAVKWEGIVNDPIGVLYGVLVFEALLLGSMAKAVTIQGVLLTLVAGVLIGLAGFALVVLLLRKNHAPDYLQSPLALMVAIAAYALANQVQHECGLLSVTVMGMALANQRWVSVKHIIEFKESLGVLLLSFLFIVLSARMQLDDLRNLHLGCFLFILVLLFVSRPLAVLAATFRSGFTWRETAFLAWMAPRGIVAAAVTSVLALRLEEAGFEQAREMAPMMFLIVAATVTVYGLGAGPLARRLKLAQASPQGALIVGAHGWARTIADALSKEGLRVLLIDSNYQNVSATRMAGLSAIYGNALSEQMREHVNLHGIGRILALTANDEANALAVLHFGDVFGRSELYQLPTGTHDRPGKEVNAPRHLRGRTLFGEKMNYNELSSRFQAGTIKKTTLTEAFTFADFKRRHGEAAMPLFVVTEAGVLLPFTAEDPPTPRPGAKLISLIAAQAKAT